MRNYFFDREKKRLTCFGAFWGVFAVLALFNCAVLANPPCWDEIVGLHNQALYLAKNHFDFLSLFSQAQSYVYGGSGIYRHAVMPWVYSLLYCFLPPVACHVAGHLLNIAFLAGAAAVLLKMLRRVCSEETAWPWVLLALSEPIVAGRSAAMGQDAALAFCVISGAAAFLEHKDRRALLWGVLAFFVKFTGVILLLAFAVYYAWETVCALRRKQPACRSALLCGVSAALAAAAVVVVKLTTTGIDGTENLNMLGWFFDWREVLFHWKFYYPLLLPATLGVVGWFLWRYFSDAELRQDDGRLLLIAIFLGGYWAAYFLSSMPRLPRYSCITVFPLALLAGYSIQLLHEKRLQAILIALFCVHAFLWQGTIAFRLTGRTQLTPNFHERNREFLNDIALDRELCALLEKQCFEREIVVKWPYVQMLGVPEFRYVSKALPHLRVVGNNVKYAPSARQFDVREMTLDTLLLYSPRGFEFYHHPRFAPPPGVTIEWVENPENPLFGAILYSGCAVAGGNAGNNLKQQDKKEKTMNDCFYVCGASNSSDSGIYRFKPVKGGAPKLVGFSEFPNVNFLAWSPDLRHLYASGNNASGGVVGTFEVVADGGLKPVNQIPSNGKATCYITASPDGKFLYCANYTSGSFSEFAVENGVATGLLRVIEHHGSGPNAKRQESAHVHYTEISPDGKYLLVVDLGTDTVSSYRLTPSGVEETPAHVLHCKPGNGPRHLAFTRDGKTAYCINELGNSVTSCRYDDGKFEEIAEAGTLPRFWKGATKAAAVRLSDDERFLLASNRGFDTIAVFALDGKGGMKLQSLPYCGGVSPRDVNFIAGTNLVGVSNEGGNLVLFDYASGRLTPNGAVYPLPRPNFLLCGK